MPVDSYPGPETISRYVLDNNIVVLVYENKTAQSVVVDGLVRTGALAEERERAGLADFTAQMLLRGSRGRSFEETFEALESVGGHIDFGAGRHATEFTAGCLTEDLDLILEIVADSLRHPEFPEKQLESVRGEIMASLQIRANDTRHMAALSFRKLLYQEHPYGQSVEGYIDSVQSIDRSLMAEYHKSYFGPDGMIITLVGAIEPQTALRKVREIFGDWEQQQKHLPPVPPVARPESTLRIHHQMPEKTQSDIMLGVPGPHRSAPDYLETSMANTVLGVFGMYGRLGKNVREAQGLAYYAYSHLSGGLGPSPWFISTGVAPDKVDVALTSILEEVERLIGEPVPADELEDSKAYRIGSLPVGLETNRGIASVLTDMELYELGLDYLQLLPDTIAAMTPDKVRAAAEKYLSAEQIAISIAGP